MVRSTLWLLASFLPLVSSYDPNSWPQWPFLNTTLQSFIVVAYQPYLPWGQGLTGYTLQFAPPGPDALDGNIWDYCSNGGGYPFMLSHGIILDTPFPPVNFSAPLTSTTAAVLYTNGTGEIWTNCNGTLIPISFPPSRPLTFRNPEPGDLITSYTQIGGNASFPYEYAWNNTPYTWDSYLDPINMTWPKSYLRYNGSQPPTGGPDFGPGSKYNFWQACPNLTIGELGVNARGKTGWSVWKGNAPDWAAGCDDVILAAVSVFAPFCTVEGRCRPGFNQPISPAPQWGKLPSWDVTQRRQSRRVVKKEVGL